MRQLDSSLPNFLSTYTSLDTSPLGLVDSSQALNYLKKSKQNSYRKSRSA